jgi:hypothetical protein
VTTLTALRCDDSRRRDDAAAAGLNGIDHLEVVSADQRTLAVHMLLALPGQPGGPATPALTPEQVRVDGGVRVLGVRVTGVSASGSVLTVTVDRAGDFSPYTLRLVASPGTEAPPAGFDPALAAQEFSFKAGCPSPYDCEQPPPAGLPRAASPVIDYLARDYAGLVRLLTDRLSLTGAGTDASPADGYTALVELLADLGDRLSYEQDAVGTEAYLGTARSRVSLRRHARLLDHQVDDGANAGTWVHVEVTPGGALDGQVLPAGTLVLSGGGGSPPGLPPGEVEAQVRAGALVFETADTLVPSAARNRIALHTWSDADCVLPAGSTAVSLVGGGGLTLAPGDLLVLEEERSPLTGSAADADPAHRHLVTLTDVAASVDPVTGVAVLTVGWSAAQALPVDLVVSARVEGAGPPVATAAARANVVRVDHGRRVQLAEPLAVPTQTDRPFRPWLDLADLALVPAPDGSGALVPALELDDGETVWVAALDLLGAAPDDPLVVVEMEHGHRPRLRFGDGRFGRRPAPGTVFTLRARVGTGPAGNVGADALSRLVTATPAAVLRVHNPLPATGGRAPESRDRVLTDAPATLRRQERAVTAADWVEVAQRHPAVQRAHARLRWTGSWWTVLVAVDRVGGGSVLADAALAAELRSHLDRFRMAGTDVRLVDPLLVPLDLQVEVSVEAGYYRSEVARAVRAALSPGPHPDGSLGLFHPDRLTFGQHLYLSAVHAAIGSVPGVRCADVIACHRLGQQPADELTSGVVRVAAGEVLRLDDDPARPEHGRLRVDATGGV